ncbi:MAG: MgtC/SapB family protein [Halobacteria archaeon]|nr:MgtC/SapB family protein [Halobacteria archaeon]
MALPLAVELVVAVGVGGLIGIERERSVPGQVFAGSRTLPLVALLGAVTNEFFESLLAVAFTGVVALSVLGYVYEASAGKPMWKDESRTESEKTGHNSEEYVGITTSVSTVITFIYGGMATQSEEGLVMSVVLGTLTMAILAAKEPIHSFAGRIGEDEMFNTALLFNVGIPVAGMTAVGLVLSVLLFFKDVSGKTPGVDLENPFRLKPALGFGVFFAVILLVSNEASQTFGDLGIYATALLSGLVDVDVDSITISLSKLALDGSITPRVAANGIVIGAITNTLVKIGIAVVLGTRSLGVEMAKVLVPTVMTGLVLVFVV